MPRRIAVHTENPQGRHLIQAAEWLRQGGVIAFPTDSCYALGCHLGDKEALDRLRAIREMDERHHLTLMCRDLSEIAKYARVDNAQYRLLKASTPGSYVFILEGTKELPRRVMHPKRKTIGLRVPDHAVALALLEVLGEPMLTSTLLLPGEEAPLTEAWEIQEALAGRIDLVLDGGHCGIEPTTVIDLTGNTPELVRQGKGPLTPFALGAP
jgi:tRNA threonylcarbamoyl adenosine modification protein (Sua5/YciO/YrdC/YwlC family)